MTNQNHELAEGLNAPDFVNCKTTTKRFLQILSIVYSQHRGDFDKVLKIKGRYRVVFSKNPQEIEDAGASPSPRKISDSSYWVMTKTSSEMKRRLLTEVLTIFRYSKEVIAEAVKKI